MSALAVLTAMPMEMTAVARVVPPKVFTAVTGIGMARATAATERLLDDHNVSHVVMIGIAGGVDPSLPIGTVVEPEVVRDHATGAEYRPNNAKSGTLVTADDFLVAADIRGPGVVAVDMETAAVGEVCERRAVKWSVYRAISDRPGSVSAAIAALAKPDGNPDVPAAIRYVLRHPWHIPRLVRLGLDGRTAANAAARAAADAHRWCA